VSKKRLDIFLVERGLLSSREKAQRTIRAGLVTVDGRAAGKPGQTVGEEAVIEITRPPRYVGRGGEKLKGALEDFGLSAANLTVCDLGSSTGGFTDCLLQEGARRVYCLDVGRGQLHWKLREDPRVTVREGFNARYLAPGDLPERPDLVTIALSFISLKKVLPSAAGVLGPAGLILSFTHRSNLTLDICQAFDILTPVFFNHTQRTFIFFVKLPNFIDVSLHFLK